MPIRNGIKRRITQLHRDSMPFKEDRKKLLEIWMNGPVYFSMMYYNKEDSDTDYKRLRSEYTV